MNGERVKITIDNFGRPTIDAIGFHGRSCTEVTKGLEKALSGDGAGKAAVVLKDEFYEVAPQEQAYETAGFGDGY